MREELCLVVNGKQVVVVAEPDATLLDVLRSELDLRGSRFGCGLGQCGACSVLVDGRAAASCETPMWSVRDRSVTTVEGLGHDGALHPLQQALLDEQAAQCGYCISGILVRAAALLHSNPEPDEPAVIDALDRSLCRCGAQQRIVRAVVRCGHTRGNTP
ncbi:MAG: (2Fe-2S)-binding protein [Nocardioidaceae bacterium]